MAKSYFIHAFVLWLFVLFCTGAIRANDGYCVRATAQSFIGVHEKGGNNQGFNDAYFRKLLAAQGWKPGYAWCSFFVMAMLYECGINNTITGWSPSTYNRNDVIYTGGKFVKAFNDGDVLIMSLSYRHDNSRYKGIGHTGIVDRIGEHSVRTIEGNTNQQGMRDSRTGDGVYYKVRPLNKTINITRWKKSE